MKRIVTVSEKKERNFFFAFMGTNRTGKSSVLKKHIIDKWVRKNPGKTVYVYDPQRNFYEYLSSMGVKVVELRPYEDWEEILLNASNCLVVLDDYRGLVTKSRLSDKFLRFIYDRELKNIDIVLVTHAPSQYHAQIHIYVTDYIIFRTNADEKRFSEAVPNGQNLSLVAENVRKYVAKHGSGNYEDMSFRYVIINVLSQEISFSPGIKEELYLEVQKESIAELDRLSKMNKNERKAHVLSKINVKK